MTDIVGALPLAILGDSVTTDHISPAGSIKEDSPAGRYLIGHQVPKADFNSYGSRRGNHEVMMRGTFANIRIKNEMVPGVEGGMTKYAGETMAIYDAAMKHKADGTPLVILARQGIRHRLEPRLGGQGHQPARGARGDRRELRAHPPLEPRRHGRAAAAVHRQRHPRHARADRRRRASRSAASPTSTPGQDVQVEVTRADGSQFAFTAKCRIDTANEMEYYRNGGILQYVLRKLAA